MGFGSMYQGNATDIAWNGGGAMQGIAGSTFGGYGAQQPSIEQQQILAQMQQIQAQLASQQSIASMNNTNNLQLAGLNNASAQNIAGQNNASNNALAGIQTSKYNQGLSLLGLLGGGQGGGQAPMNLGQRPATPAPLPTRGNISTQQVEAYNQQLSAQAQWDFQNSQQQAQGGQAGSQQLGGLGQAIAGGGSGLGGSAQQLLALGLIDPQIASVVGQQQTAAMNNANNLDVTRLTGQNTLANTGLQNQGNLDVTRLNNENQLANTGLQNSGVLNLANVNNASDLEQLVRSLTSQESIANANNQNALQVAGINTQPALQAQQLARDQFQNRNNLLTQILGQSGGVNGLFAEDTGANPLSVAQSGANNGDVSSQYLQQLIAGADDQFTAMPQELFQQQLNQILGNSASALGGQLRSAQAAAGGAGMGANSGVAQALQNRYGQAANASTQNSLTNAFLGKYNTDFQRQQAQAGYRQGLGQLALGQTTQNQQYGLGLGNLQLGQQQNSTTRRGQNLGLLGQLTA